MDTSVRWQSYWGYWCIIQSTGNISTSILAWHTILLGGDEPTYH